MGNIDQYINGKELIGTNDKNIGLILKKRGKIRRYKLIETTKSDKEIKEK